MKFSATNLNNSSQCAIEFACDRAREREQKELHYGYGVAFIKYKNGHTHTQIYGWTMTTKTKESKAIFTIVPLTMYRNSGSNRFHNKINKKSPRERERVRARAKWDKIS